MPSSNAFHGGRPHATYAQFFRDGSPDSLSFNVIPEVNCIPANVTPVNHDDVDIFFDTCESIGDDTAGNKSPSLQMSQSAYKTRQFDRMSKNIGDKGFSL